MVRLNLQAAVPFVSDSEMEQSLEKAFNSFDILTDRSGRGNDFLGWTDLPSKTDNSVFNDIYDIVNRWERDVEIVVVIGIGGSYLGAKAAIDSLSHSFTTHLGKSDGPSIVYAGQNLSEEYLSELLELLEERSFACVVISKSGTTTEPAVAFRLIKQMLEQKYGKKEARRRIVAVTDNFQGALKGLANQEGYSTFVIPDDVGGRYSVLTPVGLLPVALAGFDIRSIIDGAIEMERICAQRSEKNPAIIYATIRNALYSKDKKIEILVNYNPKLQYFAEWWKQLFGESEGKEEKGIFPASVNNTTDLHSMGQYIQEGERTIFETVISVARANRSLSIVDDPNNLDGLNFLSGKSLDECNKMAELGTRIAHIDGGVPNIQIEIPSINEYNLGALFYFFEFACGISAYMIDINPFDQPGVEDYKINMFALLGKPGYEAKARELRGRFQ
ncbi:MAG: glucose-6-phosphate isomerase [Bacteroidetes bacterium GWF2_40_14]|nr:MAG: glucose-6-phosphate isomerase [Bacteroidetes bacterium GWF2_40_14]